MPKQPVAHGCAEVRIDGDTVVAVCLCGKPTAAHGSESDAAAELDKHVASTQRRRKRTPKKSS